MRIKVESLHYDTMFKKAFRHVELFTGLVKDFTGIQLEIDEVQHDKVFDKPIGRVKTKFDLFAEDKKNRIIVEAQHANYSDNFSRFLYYHYSAIVELIASSKNYEFPMTVITLVFFTNKNSPSPDSGIFVFDTAAAKDFITGKVINNVVDCQHKVFYVFTKDYAHQNTPDACRNWMEAITDTLDESADDDYYDNPLVKQLFQIISKDQTTSEERAKMKDEFNQKLVEMNAFEKGEKIGRTAEKRENARNFKALGKLTAEEIANVTGLTLEEVQAL